MFKLLIKWKQIFVIWLSLGIAVSGYFYLYPIKVFDGYIYRSEFDGKSSTVQVKTNMKKHKELPAMEISVLATVVGCVLIGGLGYLNEKKDS